MNGRFASLVTCVAMLAVAGCARPSIPPEDLASVCEETGAAMTAVDEAMLATADGRNEWAPAIAAVGAVVDEAQERGYRGAVELAEDWETSVVAASAADDPETASSLLIESQGNEGLLFMCDAAGAPVPGVESVADGDLEPDVPGWAGPTAWLALAMAVIATAVVRRRRPGAHLVRGALQGLLTGALLVLVPTVVVGGWMLADLDMFGLSLSTMDGIRVVLADPATPVWALLLGGTTGAVIGLVVQLVRLPTGAWSTPRRKRMVSSVMFRESSNPTWRAVLWAAVTVVLVGVVATAVPWVVDPSAPSTSCISGGGTTTEAVVCIAPDAVASMALWMAIVGVPAVLVVAGVAFVLDRRRNG